MKINEAIVIDNKVIDELMTECMHSAVYEVLECIKQHSKPLEPIVRDAISKIITSKSEIDKYLNKTEI